MKIVFMGTPAFAATSLAAVLEAGHTVVGVLTQPDRPKGRGQVLVPSPVKLLAARAQLPLLQPLKMKDPALLAALAAWQPDVIAVAAFGRLLPPAMLALPPRGCINVHGSLLPKYRGAGPIQWALIHGETETGITTMLMDEGMDTGAILLQAGLAIDPEDTAGTLGIRLAVLGGRLLVDTLAQLEAGTLVPRAQNGAHATVARLLTKDDGVLDWTLPATTLANLVRGLAPWPRASTTVAGGGRWTLWRAVARAEATTQSPGTVLAVTADALHVATGDGVLVILEMQPANGRRMAVGQYVAGHPVLVGARLGGPRADAS